MLETFDSGTKNPSLAVIALKPRQVMLAEQSTKKTTTMKKNQNETLTMNSEQRTSLLHSVFRFLESNGFLKTLKRFLAEAQIEDDGWRNSSLNLEDMFLKYLKTFKSTDKSFHTIDGEEIQTDVITKKDRESTPAATEETVNKKKKKSEGIDKNAALDNSGAVINPEEILANDIVAKPNAILKERRKSKKSSDSLDQNEQNSESLKEVTNHAVCELQLDESTKEPKEKKKKKSKLASKLVGGNVEQEQLNSLLVVTEEKSKDLVSSKGDGKADSEGKVVTKDKKKKSKPNADSIVESAEQCDLEDKNGVATDKIVLGNSTEIPLQEKKAESKSKKRKKDAVVNDSKKESFQASEDVSNDDKKRSKKRKRLISEENAGQCSEEVSVEESKCRKTKGLEEVKSSEQLLKANALPGGSGHAGGERKAGNDQNNYGEAQKTSIEQINGDTDRNILKNEVEKSGRKQRNGSAEPKTVNAFKRVKVDEVVFSDERLQDNSYWAKDGAEVGYGAKAQEVLGQVRGRDFRHEKTKKKRGSYRGGQIDLQSHSVKFDYSDED